MTISRLRRSGPSALTAMMTTLALAWFCAGVAQGAGHEQFTHRIAVRVASPGDEPRKHCPVALSIKAIRAAAGDFNPANCAVVAAGRELPHQIDQLDPAAGKELSFLIDTPAKGAAACWLHFSPTGKRVGGTFAARTATAEDWVPPNIGWESTLAGYRAYWGQFDFFGKRPERNFLLYPRIKGVGYHAERPWGIDALHVGKTSGLGGLTVYVGDRACLVQNPAGKGHVKFTKRMLAAGPVRAAVEFAAGNVVPDRPGLSFRIVCLIYAEHQESEIRVSAPGAASGMLLAPGLNKLRREKTFLDKAAGCLGVWGFQQNAIGDVGMAVIVPPGKLKDMVELAAERRLRCDFSDGALRYWIIGDWARGRRDPAAATLATWRRDVHALAQRLHRDVQATLGAVERVR